LRAASRLGIRAGIHLELKTERSGAGEVGSIDRREFLQKEKPIVDLYERVRAAEEAA